MPEPTVTITHPPESPSITLPFTARGTTTAPGDDPVQFLIFEIDDLGAGPIETPPANWTFELTTANCGPGPHTLIVTAINNAGNGVATRSFSVQGHSGTE